MIKIKDNNGRLFLEAIYPKLTIETREGKIVVDGLEPAIELAPMVDRMLGLLNEKAEAKSDITGQHFRCSYDPTATNGGKPGVTIQSMAGGMVFMIRIGELEQVRQGLEKFRRRCPK